ncbi:MAG: penicillin-binding protein 2 [bacterium]|nr:penicillin-binding protein 2 [bacterium]
MGYRLPLLIGALTLGYSALLFQLYDVQVAHREEYIARAESQYALSGAFTRGAIYFTDKNGTQLSVAVNKDFPTVYANSREIEHPRLAAEAFAPIVGKPVDTLVKIFSNASSAYYPLLKKADKATVKKVEELDVKGVAVEQIPGRFYPFSTLAAQVIGFVSPNDKDDNDRGRYGIEKYYDDELAGTSSSIKGDTIVPAHPGDDITLTLDPTIQTQAELVLKNLIKTWDSDGGSIAVAEPKTGRILAMASYPSFDPNDYKHSDIKTFMNPVIEQIYEPGSMFKAITMAAGIDAGKITPNTKFNDTGSLKVSGHTIRNWDLKAHGFVTMTNVLEQSINTGAAFAEEKTGDMVFTNYLKLFGFGEKTGIDLPGELKGNLRNLYPKAPVINFRTASFGQGVSVTPIEVLSAFGAIANGGVLMRPYVNAALEPQVIRRVIRPDSAKTVMDMMVSAVDKADIAHIEGYTLAGKTGTAQIPDFVRGGYSDRVIDSYIGFGPTRDPQFIILVKLDEPPGAPHAAETVVPAFRELAQFILNYYNIPPDNISRTK